MGTWTNGPAFNVIAWGTVVVVALLTLISTLQTIFPQWGAQ
jgi:Mn2+/Fe2+ NRAMP family transporter